MMNCKDKHPDKKQIKTYKDDFFEKFPNAPKNDYGAPTFCPDKIYPEFCLDDCFFDDTMTCSECWNKSMED